MGESLFQREKTDKSNHKENGPMIILMILLAFVTAPIFAQEATPTTSAASVPSTTPMERSFVSFRISGGVWEDAGRFADLLDLFDKYPGVTDEITFFTENTHTPPRLDIFEKRLATIKKRIAESKKRGYKSGINILCTVGHHPESLGTMIGPEYPRCMTIDGRIGEGTLCMNQPIFRERVRHIYTLMAEADPDYIWIDDDVRFGHWINSAGEAGNFCFCDTCMKIMSEKFGEEMTREKLSPLMSDSAIRQKVLDFNSDSINSLFALIEETVHAVRPDLALGFMTGERYVEGYDFTRWAETLAGPGRKPVWWRPGGGFYTQDDINGMTRKAHDIGRQISLLPPSVRVIESEIENFPYAPLQKSRHITALEAAVHIAAGCTGAAFNVVTMNHEPVADYEALIAELARWRPFYDTLVKNLGRKPIVGAFPMWKRTDYANTIGNHVNGMMPPIFDIGIPIAYQRGDSPVLIPTNGYLAMLTGDEAKEILSHGVYTDVWGVSTFNDPNHLNLLSLTGIEFGSEHAVDSIEVYSDDPLNGEFAGIDRNQPQSFWRDRVYGLYLTDPAARSLARLIDFTGQTTAETSMAVFENELGGRIAVAGYHPWNFFQSRPKATQMKRLMRWLSNDRLCGWVESFERGNLWVRADENGDPCACVFLNATYDDALNPVLMLRTASQEATVYRRDVEPVRIAASDTDGPYRRFELPGVGAWEMALVVVEAK